MLGAPLRLLRRVWPARAQRRRVLMFVGVGTALTGCAIAAYAVGLLGSLERQSVDTRFSIRGPKARPADPLLVYIDDRSFGALQRYPFPRRFHARVIDRLIGDGARVIGYDVQFTERTDPADDGALLDAVARARGRVLLSTTEVDAHGHTNVFGGEDVVRGVGARVGMTLLPTDRGNVIRHVPYSIGGLESLPLLAAETVTGRHIRPSDLGGRTAWIDYVGGPGRVRSLSFSDVYAGRFAPGTFRGRVVFVGASSPTLQDVHATSTTGGNALMPGPEIQANAYLTARAGFPLRDASGWLDVLSIVALGMVAPLAALRWGDLRALAMTVGAGAAFALAAQLAFGGGTVLAVVYPLAALLASAIGSVFVQSLLNAFERERVRGLFARFVPEQVVDEVIARADGARLGGVLLEGTILFSDLRGFTTYSETRPAEEVIAVLNRYMSEMTDAILDNGGTLTAFMGDGIMALFGGPLEHTDHADRALRTAKEMLTRMDPFNRWLGEQGNGEGFRVGIGLNSGPIMAGNIGSERRLDYTAIGDTVNTAARLEAMTKGTPHQLFVADSTRAMLTAEHPELLELGELEVRGRQGRIRVWSIADGAAVGEGSAAKVTGGPAAGGPAGSSASAASAGVGGRARRQRAGGHPEAGPSPEPGADGVTL